MAFLEALELPRAGCGRRFAAAAEAPEWAWDPERTEVEGMAEKRRPPGATRALRRPPGSAARPLRRRVAPALAALVLVALAAGPAAAGPWVDRTTGNLREDPVYVHPDARPPLPPAAAARVRARIARTGTPVFVAVLPRQAAAEAGGDAGRLAALVAGSLGRPGTYLVVAGGRPGAGSDTLGRGEAADLARSAFRRHRGDLGAATLDFVGRVDRAAGAPPPTTAPPSQRGQDADAATRDTVLQVVLALALLAALVVLADIVAKRLGRRRSLRLGQEVAEVRALVEEDLRALSDDLRNLDVDLRAVESEQPRAVSQYTRAYEQLERASDAFDRARTVEDVAPVSSALESGRFAMDAARAMFEGRDPPRRRPPCFFDTRHGTSVDDVGWEPKGAPPRPVPACLACRRSIASGVQPQARRVRTGGRRVPFYEAPPYFESWFGGYFGGAAADLVGGLPLGKALDDGFVGGINTFGGGYGYLPVSYAETGIEDSGGALVGKGEADAGTITIQEDPDADQDGGGR
jgi:hypothetical protein